MLTKYDLLIVDDENSGRTTLRLLLEKEFWAHIKTIEYAQSFEEAAEKLKMSNYHVIFLDINLKGISAFDLISFIPPASKIVFVTAYPEFVFKALRNRAFDYLLKPVKEEELRDCLQRILKDLAEETQKYRLHIKERGLTRILNLNEILYIKGNGPYSTFYVHKDNYTTARTLKSILPELGEDFVRVHKSYVVNRYYIKGYNKEKLFLHNETCLPISRSGLKNLLG